MKLIVCDIETYYDKEYSLSKMTTEEYIRDPRFEVIGLSIKVDDGETMWGSGTHEQIKRWLHTFDWSDAMLLAHNTMFDGAILSWVFGVHPKALADTLCMGRALDGVDVGGSLAAMAKRYGLGEKGTEVVNALGKRRADFTEEELSRYGDYCINDVELTYKLFRRMAPVFPKTELKLIDMTLRMFTEPHLELDRQGLENHLKNVRQHKNELLIAAGITDKKDLMSNAKFAELLQGLGVEPPTKISPTTGKETFAFAKTDDGFKALLEHEDDRVQALAAARLGNKSTLEETRTERFIGIAGRGKFPVPIKYYGAHTGRWASLDKVGIQNLPSRGPNAKAIKNCIMAPEGYVLVDCDSSQIEARVLAWLAGQWDLVEAFANKEDVYIKMASRIYGKPEDQIDKHERFVGKTTVLGCFAADTKVLTDSGWKDIVQVQSTDLVWDGVEWVSHGGVVPQGVKETIRCHGIAATSDHEILTAHGWKEWSEVHTNHSLFQSAIDKGRLPSWSGSGTITTLGGLPASTPLCGATAAGRGGSTDTTSPNSALRAVTRALKSLLIPNDTGSTERYFQTTNTAPDSSTGYRRALVGAITRTLRPTRRTVVEVSKSMVHGVKIAVRSSAISSLSTAGMCPSMNSTAQTTTVDTSPETFGSSLERGTWKTEEQSFSCKKRLMTYDIAYAGPRNRYTIATTAGPIIVHNCGYGMGAVKFQAQLKNFGVDVDLDEARRIISIYRDTNPHIVKLWRDCQDMIKHLANGQALQIGREGVLYVDAVQGGVRLPSGLLIYYPKLHAEQGEKGPEYVFETRKGPSRIYGGKAAENATQAIARCVVGEQMLRISKRYKPALTVHDSVVVLVPEAEQEEGRAWIEEQMRWVPPWAEGLPVDCESDVGRRYGAGE
jgi:DNA polymerase I-like protein with 3'-5' exonuclease and polymerase domains